MKQPFWNWVDQEDGSAELRLDGVIAEESFWGDETTPKDFKKQLNAHSGPITVWINSPGGDVFAASEIYTMLMEYPGAVTVKIDGIAASAASVIAMAGERVEMAPTSIMMIHNPATVAAGDAKEMRQVIKVLDEVKETIINAYEIKTGLPRDRIWKMMDDETWMNAKKAVSLGFADCMLYEDAANKDDVTDGWEASGITAIQRAAVTNLISRIQATAEPEEPEQPDEPAKPAEPEPDTEEEPEAKGVDMSAARRRLNLLAKRWTPA